VALIAQFLWSTWREPHWRVAVAITAALLCGLNTEVVRYGGVGQAYGLCLLLIVAAFRFAILAVGRSGIGWALAAVVMLATFSARLPGIYFDAYQATCSACFFNASAFVIVILIAPPQLSRNG
jgi:hypothetical protein